MAGFVPDPITDGRNPPPVDEMMPSLLMMRPLLSLALTLRLPMLMLLLFLQWVHPESLEVLFVVMHMEMF